MKRVGLDEMSEHLGSYLQMAQEQDIVITRHGRPARVLIGFASEDEWLEYELEHDAAFVARVA